MTEIPKGVFISKELGMAVGDRLLQAEKQPKRPSSEPTPKQQGQGHQTFHPFTAEQRADRQVALPLTSETQKWAFKFAKQMVFNRDAEGTDADWERLQKLDPRTYNAIKDVREKQNRLRPLKEQAGGDEKVFKELWEKEIGRGIAKRYEGESPRTERELAEEKWAEKFLEEMVSNPDAQATDAEWERLYRLDDSTYGRAKSNLDFKNYIRRLKKMPQFQKDPYEVLERAAYAAKLEEEKTEAWAKNGTRRLPGEVYSKKNQHDIKKWNEKTDEEKKRIYKERLKKREDYYPLTKEEKEKNLFDEARNELHNDPLWKREQFNKARVEIHGLPPLTEKEYEEYEKRWDKWEKKMRRSKRFRRKEWQKFSHAISSGFRTTPPIDAQKTEMDKTMLDGETKEFTPKEKQLIAMGEIGAKLGELNVPVEDRKKVFEELAKDPKATGKVAEVLKKIQPGDTILVQAYLKAIHDEIKRLSQTKEKPEELTWWQLLFSILGAILVGMAEGVVGEEIDKEKK